MALFTPILKGKRVRWTCFEILTGDPHTRGPGLRGLVRGPDKIIYWVYGRACGTRCFCDAEVMPVQIDALRLAHKQLTKALDNEDEGNDEVRDAAITMRHALEL